MYSQLYMTGILVGLFNPDTNTILSTMIALLYKLLLTRLIKEITHHTTSDLLSTMTNTILKTDEPGNGNVYKETWYNNLVILLSVVGVLIGIRINSSGDSPGAQFIGNGVVMGSFLTVLFEIGLGGGLFTKKLLFSPWIVVVALGLMCSLGNIILSI